jgi:pilus assembly protein CpaD
MAIKNFKFTHVASSALIALAALTLGGCMADNMMDDDGMHVPARATENYPITLAKGPQTIEIAAGTGTLDPGQVNAVKGFVHQAAQAGVTPMTVSRPSGGGASARLASEVASVMLGQGVPRNRVAFTTYPGPASGPVKISYVSSYAQTKPCGNWPTDLADTESNTSYENLGCAVQANIAAEIANPETLVTPPTPDLKNSAAAAAAIGRADENVNHVTLQTNYKYTSTP